MGGVEVEVLFNFLPGLMGLESSIFVLVDCPAEDDNTVLGVSEEESD